MADKEEADSTSGSTPSASGDPTLGDYTIPGPGARGHGSHALNRGEPGPDEEDFAADQPADPADPAELDGIDPDEDAEPPAGPLPVDGALVEDDPMHDVRDDGDRDDPDDDVRDGELVTVGAPAKKRAANTDDAVAAKALARSKKDKATRRQKEAPASPKRTTPATFVKESAGELRKVVYPTGQQLVNYFIVVLIFVLFIIAIVSLLDLAFGAAILKLFS